MFEFLLSLRSTLMEMMPRGGIQIANTKSIELTESKKNIHAQEMKKYLKKAKKRGEQENQRTLTNKTL